MVEVGGARVEEELEDPDEYKEIQNLRWFFFLPLSFVLSWMRRCETLFLSSLRSFRVRLNEAKNLAGEKPSKKVEKTFDPYCVILIDSERKATTSTKPSTTNPFWGEEFFFE